MYNLRRMQVGGIEMTDVLSAIAQYRQDRGWSEYQLAERSGLPQSTISSWYRKDIVPTVPSLEKICEAFGITLSQLFATNGSPVTLTKKQTELLERWDRLDKEQQKAVFQLIDNMNSKRYAKFEDVQVKIK